MRISSTGVRVYVRFLINWCFETTLPLGIISGLKREGDFHNEISIIYERINKAEVRPGEESEKAECRDNLWNEVQFKGPQRQK